MATPNIVPRAEGEGGLGTAAKGWGGTFVTNTTTSSATEGGKLVLAANDGAVMGNTHRLGVIEFKAAEDTSSTLSIGARIESIARDAWDGSNNDADLRFYTTDGTTESLVLKLDADKLATFGGSVSIDNVSISAIQSSGESFVDDDTSLMTSASIQDKILAYGYTTATGDITGVDLTGGTNLTVASETGTTSGNYSCTLNVDDAFLVNDAADTLAVSDFGANAALFINADQPATTGAEDSKGLHIDYDRIVAASGTAAHNDIGIDLDVNSATLGTGTVTGMDIDVVGATSGTHTAIGIDLDVDSADTNIGMQINTAGTHMKLVANADVNDYATITLADTGDLTIETVGSGTTDSDMTLTIDGNIALNSGTTSVNSTSIPLRKFAPTGTGTNGAYSGGDVVYFGGTTSMTAGAIYHYKSDGTWELADADAVATSDGLLAVALGAASDTNGMLLRGMVTIDHDPGAIGDVLFLSTTAGDCSATAPSGSADIVRVIGYQVNHASNGEIWFCPDGTYVELA